MKNGQQKVIAFDRKTGKKRLVVDNQVDGLNVSSYEFQQKYDIVVLHLDTASGRYMSIPK